MARPKRRRSAPPRHPSSPPPPGLSRKAKIWLATLSTVVSAATGMFTLRDEVFPRESITASALAAPGYRVEVGKVCDELNELERARPSDDRRLGRRLKAAKTTFRQRDALMEAYEKSASDSAHALSRLGALDAPKVLVAVHRRVETTWDDNHRRVLAYIEALDRIRHRNGLRAAIDGFSRQRTTLARQGRRIDSGLQRLAGGSCELIPTEVTPTLTLPDLPARVNPPRTAGKAPRSSTPRRLPGPSPTPENLRTEPKLNTPNAAPTPDAPAPRLNPDAVPRVNPAPRSGPRVNPAPPRGSAED